MTIEAWLFSAKRAWQDPWVKGVTLLTVLFVLGGVSWFITNIIPLRYASNGQLVLHYNIYVGIDALGAWGWLFVPPLVWVAVVALDIAWAFGVYREDIYQSWTFLLFAPLWSLPWMVALWHLVRINM